MKPLALWSLLLATLAAAALAAGPRKVSPSIARSVGSAEAAARGQTHPLDPDAIVARGGLMVYLSGGGQERTAENPIGLPPSVAKTKGKPIDTLEAVDARWAALEPYAAGGWGGVVDHLSAGNEGVETPGEMDLDNEADAVEHGYAGLTAAAAAGAARLASQATNPAWETIAYVGKWEADLRALAERGPAGRVAAWDRADRTLRPYLAIGASIAFDYSAGYAEGDGAAYVRSRAELVRLNGGRVYLEAVPRADRALGPDSPPGAGVCVWYDDYEGQRRRRDREFGEAFGKRIDAMPTVVWVTFRGDGDPENNRRAAEACVRAWARGHRVALSPGTGLVKTYGTDARAVVAGALELAKGDTR